MSSPNDSDLEVFGSEIDRWMSDNDPANPARALSMAAGLGTAARAWATPPDDAKAVLSNARLVGRDMNIAVDDSRALKTLIEAKDYEQGLARFRAQPLDGCTSIMNIARVASGFNPLLPDVKGNVERFQDYTRRILSAPFFNLGYADSKTEIRQSEDWDDLIRSIVELFEGIEKEDRDRIKDGLANLAIAAGSRSGTKQTQNLFVQNVLQLDGGTLSIFIYYSSVVLQEDKVKGSTSRQSEFTIARSKLVFRTGDWPAFAERVWKKQVTVVDDWLDDNTTTSGDQPVNLCISA
jgi:hypothetical protein